MSEFHPQKTQFKAVNQDCLVAALREQGYEVEVHATAQTLFDWLGRETDNRANVIVRKKNFNSTIVNDLGFKTEADGTMTMVSDENRALGVTWMTELKRSYTEKVDMKLARSKGFKFLGRKVVNGRIQLQFLDTRA
jgi:hypothetical protein